MPSITIELPAEVESRLEQEASSRGLPLSDYVTLLLRDPEHFSPTGRELPPGAFPPVREAPGGALRVGQTRVSLDTVIGAHESGCSPEEIARSYPALELADIHAVIAYYLRNREQVQAYLERRRREAEELRRKVEERFPPEDVRERLLARRAENS